VSGEDCGHRPPSAIRAGCKCDRCAAVRAKAQEKRREQRATDPEYRAKRYAAEVARRRGKRATDPEYRAKKNAYEAAYQRERYANDPEYRAKKRASNTAHYRLKHQALCDKVDAIQLTQDDVTDVIWESLK
jgi:hypothetical protein